MPITSSGVGGGSSSAGDTVGPGSSTDNAVARYDGATGKLLQNSPVLISDLGAVSGGLLSIVNAGGGEVLTASDSGKQFNIRLVGGAAGVTLPTSPTAGAWYEFVVLNTDEITVQAAGSQVIYIGSSASSAGGTAKSSTKGSRLNLTFSGPNLWIGLASGTWTLA